MGGTPPTPVRKFTLLDAMILVASIGCWLALTRHLGTKTNVRNIWYLGDLGLIRMLHNQLALLLFFLSMTLIFLRLLPPRPRRRRLWSRPGFTACVSAVLGVVAKAVESGVGLHASLGTWPGWDRFAMTVLWQEWPYAGPAVAGAWLGLACSGLWRAEPSTIDRLGRLVGLAWLVEFFLTEDQFGRWTYIIARLIERGGR